MKKAEQRSSQNYWKAEYAFPTGDVYERDSLVAARDFVCFGMQGCKIGDCCRLLETSDISDLRREAAVRAAALKERTDGGHKGALLDVVQSDLQPYWDGSHFSMVNCRLSVSTQVQICASAYALAVGLTGSSAQKVFQRIKDDVPLSMPVAPEERFESKEEQVKRESLEYSMLARYVDTQLVKANEQNPAPGASNLKQTTINSCSWKEKWAACCAFFENSHHGRPVGSKSMLRRVWRKQKLIKERIASTHSKCTICCDLDVALQRLVGDWRPAAVNSRKLIRRAKEDHERIHLSIRSVFDDYGFTSMVNPSAVWCICCDAMTQKTVELPKYNTRRYRMPKN